MLYGEPRLTHDVDLIVFLREPDLPALAQAFPDESFYLPPLGGSRPASFDRLPRPGLG